VFSFTRAASTSGYVRVTSDRPITGVEIYGDTKEISALPATTPTSEGRLYFPHVVANQGYTTLLGLINSSSNNTANVALTAYNEDGSTLGTSTTTTLEPGAQLLESVSDLFSLPSGNTLAGYVIAQSDQPGLTGFTEFCYDNGTRSANAAVPADSVPHSHLAFSHVANEVAAGGGQTYRTGIALLNPLGKTASYTISVFDGAGNALATNNFTLGPRSKVAKMLSYPSAGVGFFAQAIILSGGHIEVTSDSPLLGFELFFTDNLAQIAAVPAQVIN
jgi:hypothetical protein